MNPPRSAQHSALRSDVLLRCPPAADQPLSRTRIETACHRILHHGIARDERADFKINAGTWLVRADHANLEVTHRDDVRLYGQHFLRRAEQHPDPFRTINQPRGVPQRIQWKPQTGRELCTNVVPYGTKPGQWRCSEGQATGVVLHLHQTRAALLNQDAFSLGHSPCLEPGMRRTQCGVAREGKFLAAREDPHFVVRLRMRRRQEEGGLRQVGPVGEVLHTLRTEAFGIDDDGERVAEIRHLGEDVDLVERADAERY